MKADSWVACLSGRQLQMNSNHGVEKMGSDHDVEKLSFDHGVEKLRLDHEMCRVLGCC